MVNQHSSFAYGRNIPVNASLAGSAALRVFPNPVRSSAIVSHPQAAANASLKITDLNGRVLQTYFLQQSAVQTTITLHKLMSGTYLLVYRDAAGKVAGTTLIKQ